ncbi:hypothetical protein ACWF95_34580 [Streptomyces vinaceus]
MTARLRLLLAAALALLLLTCAVAAWLSPGSRPSGSASAPAATAASSHPCGLVIGPAHGFCARGRERATVAGTSSVAVVVPAALASRTELMLFASATVSAAVALVRAVERRHR